MNVRILRSDGRIEEVELHRYVQGVVPCEVLCALFGAEGTGLPSYRVGEVLAEWPMPALEAQALAALSYARYAIAHPRHGFAHVCDTAHCQVYDPSRRHPRTDAAVERWRGHYIAYEGRVAEAVYHASCGGRTENAEDVWGQYVPYLRAVPCPCGHPRRGHGVGMCQWGCYALAQLGYTAPAIIRHFYTGVAILPSPHPHRPFWCSALRRFITWLTEIYKKHCEEAAHENHLNA